MYGRSTTRMKLKNTLLLTSLLLAFSTAHSQTLIEAFEQSLKHDPAYRAAQANTKAGEADRRIGRATLLPQLSASLYQGKAETERSLLNSPRPQVDNTEYDIKNNAVTLQQPLINLDGQARFAQGDLISKQAQVQEADAKSILSLRVTTAYLDILSALDQLRLSESETLALKERLQLVNAGIEAGETSRTDLAESRAQLDLANARLLEAKESLGLSLRTLENVTGVKSKSVMFPKTLDISAITPPPEFDRLKSRMMVNSPAVINSLFDIRIAEQEVNKQSAGHYPRLDFIARASQSESDTVTTIGQRNDQTSYALQLQVPLFSGFAVDASVDKALANLERARIAWQAQVQESAYSLQEEYSKFSVSKIKIDAFKKAVDSGRESLKAAELGLKLGIRTLSDVLEAQRLLFSTEKDLSRVRYEALASLVNLNAISGQLNVKTLTEVSELLSKNSELVEFQRPDLIDTEQPDPRQYELLDFNRPLTQNQEPEKVLVKESNGDNETVYSLQDKTSLQAPPSLLE